MIDLQPAVTRLAGVVTSVSDDDLAKPTPCPEATVGDLIDHIRTFSAAFTRSARKEGRLGPPPKPRRQSPGRLAAEHARRARGPGRGLG